MLLLYNVIANLGLRLNFQSTWNLGQGLGSLMWAFLSGRRRQTIQTMVDRLEIDKKLARKLGRLSFQHSSRSFLEIFLTRRADPRFFHDQVSIEHPEIIAKMQQENRPFVAVTGHLGAWELTGGLLRAFFPERSAQVVVRKPKNDGLHKMMTRLRTRPNLEVVAHRSAAKKVLRCLAHNGISCFLVDHNCSRDEALFLPFLGKMAAVNMGPALLALRANALVWPAFLVRDGVGRYRFVPLQPLDTTLLTGTRTENIACIASYYTQAVEGIVKRFPDQWFWMHRRWKTQPTEDVEQKNH